ncbi:MAG: 50S ribosomal protein L25 [Planctomycetota bacterium]
MSDIVTIKASNRNETGTRVTRRLRQQGLLPAIIYGHGEGVETVSLDQHEVEVAIAHGSRIFDVSLGGKTQQCLIKEVQYDYLGTNPVHLDLTRIDVDERVRVTVGIELRGTPKGVGHGGILDQHMAAIEVECIASKIPDTLHPVVSDMEIGQALLVKDLELGEGVTAIPNPDDVVATVQALATATEESETAEPEEGTAEPERIGRVRKDEDEE